MLKSNALFGASSCSSIEEGVEQDQRRQRGGADRVPLGHRLGRVADRVERVGDVANVLRQVRHLGDAAGVVGDRPEGVERDDQAGQRELGHDRDADAVDPGELVRSEDREHQHQHGRRRGLEALGQPLDDVGRVAGLRGLGDRAHGPEAGRRVVVGDHEQEGRDADSDQGAEPEIGDGGAGKRAAGVGDAEVERVAHQPVGDRVEGRGREQAGDDQAPVQGSLDVARARAHREGAHDRGEDRRAAERQRVDRDLARELAGEGEHAEQHHRDRGDGVGLEQVGRHAGAVADVVADVVGDHGGVARVVLGDPGLDLADQVRADVGGLGEDAAAEAGEDGDQRAAEAEADQGVDGLLVGVVHQHQGAVVAGDAEQRQADDEQAGDRAALEGDVERGRDAAARRLGDAGVGANRQVHADEAGGAGEDASDHEADRRSRCSAAGSAAPRRPRRRRR